MPGLPARTATPRSLDATRINLPPELTSFVGREQETAEVKRLLSTTRVLALTGAGGVGKTRLAVRVAADLYEEFSDGVWWVDLQRLTDPGLVPQAALSALRIPEPVGQLLTDTLVEYLRPRSPLLVLDNCEHLLSACAQLAEVLLRECPRVRLLATSREGLGVAGEVTFRVPSLSVPDPDHLPPVERLKEYEAVRLFVERAMLSEPRFQITPSNANAVASVCRRLDGIPLAIELAAARVKVLTVEQIASRLTNRFRLLTGGSRTSLRRQQTLRATMDWSYDLLTELERVVFCKASVFTGGWTLEAAEAVCAGEGTEASTVLDLLSQLVDKSLVVAETHRAEARYRLLETVREYGWEKLLESGHAEAVRRRHRDWFLELAEHAAPKLLSHEARVWMKRLEAEHPNLRTALEWCKDEEGGAEAEVRLAASLRHYWYFHGDWSEARAWFEHVLHRSGVSPALARSHVISSLALLLLHSLEYERGTALCMEGLALCDQMGDKERRANLLSRLGQLVLYQGDPKRAKMLFDESLALNREVGAKGWIATGLGYLGSVATVEGDLERAMVFHSESLALFREDRSSGIHFALRHLGFVLLAQGDYEQAEALHREGLQHLRDLGIRWGMGELLEGLASAACTRRHFEKAARIFGATEAWREVLGDNLKVGSRNVIREQSVAAARLGLGDSAFATAWAEGRAMTLDQAVDCALGPDTGRLQGEPPTAVAIDGALTPRECEVAALIAQGLTNRQIASRLVISERTAESHVQHILDKLDLNTRGRIGVWAIEHGLYTPAQR